MPLAYVGIRVTDLDRSVTFYTEQLGLIEKSRGTMSHGGVFVGLEDPKTKVPLELNWYPPDDPHYVPFTPGEGLDHLGFEVDDARTTIDRLLKHGATLAVPAWLEREKYWIGYVRDPDGNWIEVQSSA